MLLSRCSSVFSSPECSVCVYGVCQQVKTMAHATLPAGNNGVRRDFRSHCRLRPQKEQATTEGCALEVL